MINQLNDIEQIIQSPFIAIDVETTGLTRRAEIVSASAAWETPDGEIKTRGFWLNRLEGGSNIDEPLFKYLLVKTLFNRKWKSGRLIFHNLLFDLRLLKIRFQPKSKRFARSQLCPNIDDTMAASRILKSSKFSSHIDPGQLKCHNLKFLALEHFPEDFPNDTRPETLEDILSGASILVARREAVLRYNCKDTEYTLRLYKKFKFILSPDEWKYYNEIEMKHIFNLFHLTWHGVPFSYEVADAIEAKIEQQTEALKRLIYNSLGRVFNIGSQQELAKAIFFNPRMVYRTSPISEPVMIAPLYETKTFQAQVDIDTLKAICKYIEKFEIALPETMRSPVPDIINHLIRYLELEKSRSYLEILDRYAVLEPGGYRIFPNMSASASSGRTSCTGPNLFGIPKKLTKKSAVSRDDNGDVTSEIDEQFEALKDDTVRRTIEVPPGFKIASIDINGLDLVVIAHGAQKIVDRFNPGARFSWLDFLEKKNGKIPDSYFAILQRLDERDYRQCFAQLAAGLKDDLLNYWAMKPKKKEGIEFIFKHAPYNSEFVPFPDDKGTTERLLENFRSSSKTIILATSYLMGAKGLAVKLAENQDDPEGVEIAQRKLDNFYSRQCGYPEIRAFQDQIANQVYCDGYAISPFGRRYYAQTWDDLNEQYRVMCVPLVDEYEFIFVDQKFNKYWYIKARGWVKSEEDVIHDLKIIDRPFGLRFDEIISIQELNTYTFRPPDRKAKERQPFKRPKSEDHMDEDLNFELNRIAISTEVDAAVGKEPYRSSEGLNLIANFLHCGQVVIPEKKGAFKILMYRVHSGNPASQYFKMYTPLLEAAKKYFPLLCQGIAGTIAKLCLTRAREAIEKRLPEAVILFFIHDQMDVMYPDNPEAETKIEEILVDAIEHRDSKYPFCGGLTKNSKPLNDVGFTGTLKLDRKHFS